MWAAVSQEKKGKTLPHLPRSSFQVHQLAKLRGNEGRQARNVTAVGYSPQREKGVRTEEVFSFPFADGLSNEEILVHYESVLNIPEQ